MPKEKIELPVGTKSEYGRLNTVQNPPSSPTLGVREKLIVIFLLVKVLPLILLACIAWQALVSLGTTLRKTAVQDSRDALTTMAVENIERITTDTAQEVAAFLYHRDTDIAFLAEQCQQHMIDVKSQRQHIERLFANFSRNKTSLIRRRGDWTVDPNGGVSWVQTDPYTAPADTKERSGNIENDDEIDAATFHYRHPYGYGDNLENFVAVPLYDEIALLDKNGMQIAKYVTPHSTKKRFPFPEELRDVSDPKNTFVKAEHYFEEVQKVGKNGIYVSDVIGAYVPSRFIGMYTPDYIASKRIDAKIAELTAEEDPKNAETIWCLRVLNAELKNDEKTFNSRAGINKAVRDEIDRRLGAESTWKIEKKSCRQASDELTKLGFHELAEEVLNIPFEPEKEAFAGAENPLGIRFEGIIRWAKPVIDENNEIAGYVTFALNHDHLLDMIDHITPMQKRYTELSDAFEGNYAFIWDYQCRSIVHPRHHSICGYDPETGKPKIPWLEQRIYNEMKKAGYEEEDWESYVAILEEEGYTPWPTSPDWVVELTQKKAANNEKWTAEEIARLPIDYQSRQKRPAPELTRMGLVGLDGRYLNNAPQCTGWMDLTKDGGSGSFYILWSGLYKLTTAATIPYYTGQYSPDVRGNRRGFGFIAVGAGIDDFSRPADEMDSVLDAMVRDNIHATTVRLVWTTVFLSIIVILIAIWMASYLSKRLQWLINGITKFQRGQRDFRFAAAIKDEFGLLAHSFDAMANNVVRSVSTPLVITDMDLNIVYANEQCLDVFGHEALDNVIGKSYREKSIYHYGSPCCPITALQHGREPEVLYLKPFDRYLLGVANYLTDDRGEKQGYIIASNDVTELSRQQLELTRAKEEAELASRYKSRFLARMSHELRTPMNAIIGFNDMTRSKIRNARDTTDLQELDNYLARLKSSSLDLLNLLNDILEASNLESGSVVLLEKPLHLRKMLNEIVAKIKKDCAEKLVNFETHFDGFTPSCFIVDELRLQQVLMSLLHNAVKYTPEFGRIDFAVQQINRESGKSLLSFTVQDTGIGIAPDAVEKIFRPFGQMESAETAYTSGSGLGLTIIRRTLELFGSDIRVQSELGKGSVFSFEVWLQEKEGLETIEDSKIENIKGYFSGQNALVVDDVRLNRVVLVNLLQEAGFTTDEAKDGEKGVEVFKNSPENTYHIIFMDIQMPVLDGWEAAKIIRSLPRQDAKTVPIVTISANAFQEDVAKSLASGMNGHYAKPIQKDVLFEILMTYCQPTSYPDV